MGEYKTDAPNNQSGGLTAEGQQPLVDQARGIATQAASQAKDAISRRVGATQQQSADQVCDVADALRRSSEELKDNLIAPYMGRAAEQIERVGDYLRDARIEDVVKQAEGFARREPAIFLGGAFVLGILGARFLRASAAPGLNGSATTPDYLADLREQR
jgi:hypothetical protein